MNYYPREILGEHQQVTPEGFLVCKDVPIARTGTMVYGPGEIPVEPGPDGVIYVDRFPEDVFDQETLDSFRGRPVVLSHPQEDVTPENWAMLAVGTIMNPHRGEGAKDDLVISDLMVTEKRGIEAIREGGIREVSCGYDAEYIQTGVRGRARQVKIRGNHLALVDSGRCGPRCAIGDQKHTTEEESMSWLDKLKAAFQAKDSAAFDAALAEAPREGPLTLTKDQLSSIAALVRTNDAHAKGCECDDCKDAKTKDRALDALSADVKKIGDTVTSIDARVKKMEDKDKEEEEEEARKKAEDEGNRKIEGALEEEAPPGTGDKAKAAKDSAYLVDAWGTTVSLAEVMAPGISIPTMDSKDAPKKTYDAMCQFRRTALSLASNRPELRQFIDGLRGGAELSKITCDRLSTIFNATGAYAKDLNNRATHDNRDTALVGQGGGTGVRGPLKNQADVNKRNSEFWKQQQ